MVESSKLGKRALTLDDEGLFYSKLKIQTDKWLPLYRERGRFVVKVLNY
jgi:hypothetical protein